MKTTTKSKKETTVKDGIREVVYSSKPANFDEWFTMPVERARILFYGEKKQKDYYQTTFYQDSEKVCVGHSSITVNFNPYGALYVTRKSLHGFTFTKKTKKVKKWFGKMIVLDERIHEALYKHVINYDWWIKDLPGSIAEISQCSTTFGKVLAGKITNGRQLVKEYLKLHARGITISPEAMYQWLKSHTSRSSYGKPATQIRGMLANARYLKQPDLLFSTQMSLSQHTFRDTLKQAKQLNRKVDLTWSATKLAEIHKLWTREIMGEELKAMEDYNVPYFGELPELMKFKLIANQREMFFIGSVEDHCVYTNYWSNVKKKEYFVLYGKHEGIDYTIGIRYKRGQLLREDPRTPVYQHIATLDQIQSKRNGQVHGSAPEGLKEVIQQWLERENVASFFGENYQKFPDNPINSQEIVDISGSCATYVEQANDFDMIL